MIEVVLEKTDGLPDYYFVIIKGVPGSPIGLVLGNARKQRPAKRLQATVIAALIAYNGPELPSGGKPFWEQLEELEDIG